MFKLQLILFQVFGILLFAQQFCYGKVIMEYVGAKEVPVHLNAFPVKEGIDIHFLLSFAIDANPSGDPQNGKFSPYWEKTLTPESVAAIKKDHKNVKVSASLSGWSIGEGDIVLSWYTPDNTQQWISNAFSSLSSIAKQYHLDGIDIDYENFPQQSSSFAYCIGELITLLKNQSVISFATIAPFHKTTAPYIELFDKYEHVIDFVNYQFYTDQVRKPDSYVEAFKLRAAQFDEDKLLPSCEVKGRGIQGDAFFNVLSLLEGNGFAVNGVMIFAADASASNDFYYEKKSQDFLLNSTASV